MKISHIVPKNSLDIIDGRDFYMCLANIAYKDKEYAQYYADQVKKGAFVLLDNGAAEHDQMTLQQILEVIKVINPSEVVLSDTLCNGNETIRKSLEAIEFYRSNGYTGQFMFVPQGDTLQEWCQCFKQMSDHPEIDTFGISKFMTSHFKMSDARLKGLLYMEDVGQRKYTVHLLGCHENIDELSQIKTAIRYSCENIRIRSTDTAIAYIYAQQQLDIGKGNRPEGEIDFIDGRNYDYQLKKNIYTFDRKVS